MEKVKLQCKYALAGSAKGELLFSHDSFSFWGGVDVENGVIKDKRHGNFQQSMTKKIFAFPFGKGSSGAGTTIMEMARLDTAPAAIINVYTDPVILTGPLIATHFYEKPIPVVNLSEENYKKLEGAREVELVDGADYILVSYE